MKNVLLFGAFWASATIGFVESKADNPITTAAVGPWTNVVSFSINPNADHMVLTMVNEAGDERAYETHFESGKWGSVQPIDAVNALCGPGINVGGIFMTDNEQRIYFHANYVDGVGGFDIYYSDYTPDGWTKPVLETELSTPSDEIYPSVVNGEESVYFLRHQPVSNIKKEKKEADKMSIFYSVRDAKLKWTRPLPANNVLNTGFVQDAGISVDGVTMYYSSRLDRKAESVLYYSRMTLAGEWTLPEPLFVDNSGFDYYSVSFAHGKCYAIRSNNKKRIRQGSVVSFDVRDSFKPQTTVNEFGEVIRKGSKTPVAADLVVYNPTTLNVIGRYRSTDYSGIYDMTNIAQNGRYIIDIRSEGYSFASYQVDYVESAKPQMPRAVVLFDTIQLAVSLFDADIFRPLNGKVIAVRQTDRHVFRSQKIDDGRFLLNLPLGSDYNIIATCNGFAENKFLFKLAGDVVFSLFERELSLSPRKVDCTVNVFDAETEKPIAADVRIVNLKRDETLHLASADLASGSSVLRLRSGDSYEMTVGGVDGYSFHNRRFDVSDNDETINVSLIPLRENAAVRLDNINFASGSADILSESYKELDLVVQLMKSNPALTFEIAAHTDNVGAPSFNLALSVKRAESVVRYLLENGVDPNHIVSKGYGLTKPLVPNTSEENRARNRRVEFRILAVE